MNTFGNKTINKALKKKINLLKKQYEEAEKDNDRNEVIADWKLIVTEDWPE